MARQSLIIGKDLKKVEEYATHRYGGTEQECARRAFPPEDKSTSLEVGV